MARVRQPGTPSQSRSRELVYPGRSGRLFGVGLVAGLFLLVGATFLYLLGQRSVMSPGDVSAHHARIDLKCAQCHSPEAGVASLRCERCHDPSGTDRMTHTAHVLLGSGDRRLAKQAPEMACATCHTDHRGQAFAMREVDDRECATCHNFRGLTGHPEFAVVRALASAGVGLDFDHDRHIAEAQKARGATCQTCHEQTADRRGFQPLTFDRHCASCHTSGLLEATTGFVAAELMLKPEEIPVQALGGSRVVTSENSRGRRQATGLRHRDPWILYNAARLRRGIDRGGDDAERLALRARIQYLEQLERAPAPRRIPVEELDTAIRALQDEIAVIDARLAALQAPGTDETALAGLTAAAQAVAASLGSAQPEAPSASVTPAPAPSDPEAGARLERRKAELLALIDAIVQRAPESAGAKRAAELRVAIDGLTASSDSTEADPAALADHLSRIGDLLAPVRRVPDAGVRAELGGIDGLRQMVIERSGGGLSRGEFEGRRRELLQVLDAIEQRADDRLRVRVDALRQRALALNAGNPDNEDTRRRQRQRQLERLIVERELNASKRDQDDPPAQDASIDRAELGRALAQARARLADVESAPRMNAPTTEDERLGRANALESLLGPCLKCHEMDTGRARMAPVRVAEPVMAQSVFNHAPHVTDATCESCHSGVRTSKFATDVNVPGVAQCQTCHRPSQVRANCVTCHTYHPLSAVRLAVAAR